MSKEEKEKIDEMSDCLVDNIGTLVVEVSNAKINIIEFIQGINNNMESFAKKIMDFKFNAINREDYKNLDN